MARAYKACIINPDRTMNVHFITKKLKIGPNAFRTKKNKDEIYIIDAKYTITTTTKRGLIPFKYTTGYYKRNIPVPAPIDEMHAGTSLATIPSQAIADLNEGGVAEGTDVDTPYEYTFNEEEIKKYTKEDKKVIHVIKPFMVPGFDGWNYDGISSEELGTLFNPQFYKMIAKANKNKKEEQMFLMQIGTLAGVAFLLYYVMQSLIPSIVKALLPHLPK